MFASKDLLSLAGCVGVSLPPLPRPSAAASSAPPPLSLPSGRLPSPPPSRSPLLCQLERASGEVPAHSVRQNPSASGSCREGPRPTPPVPT